MQRARAQAWTQPFPYVSRLGTPGAHRWATVSSYAKTLHVLSRWQPSCALTPDTDNFESLEAAQRAGEEWVTRGLDIELFNPPGQASAPPAQAIH